MIRGGVRFDRISSFRHVQHHTVAVRSEAIRIVAFVEVNIISGGGRRFQLFCLLLLTLFQKTQVLIHSQQFLLSSFIVLFVCSSYRLRLGSIVCQP